MKTRYIALFFVLWSSLFLNGCTFAGLAGLFMPSATPRTPLYVGTGEPRLADILGISHSEIKFVSLCGFVETTREEATRPEYYTLAAVRRIVVLTDAHLYLLREDVSTSSTEDEIRVPFSDLSGAALTLSRNLSGRLIAYQIQLLKEDHVLVVQIGPYTAYDIPPEEAERPFNLILAAGVPKWESEKFFVLDLTP